VAQRDGLSSVSVMLLQLLQARAENILAFQLPHICLQVVGQPQSQLLWQVYCEVPTIITLSGA